MLSLYLPVALTAATILLAASIYGGVDIWAQTVAGLMAYSGGLAACLLYRRASDRVRVLPPVTAIALFSLLLWIAIQSQMLLSEAGKKISYTDGLPHLAAWLFIWVAYLITACTAFLIGQSRRRTGFMVVLLVVLGMFEAVIGILALYGDMGIYSLLPAAHRAIGTFSSGNSFGGFLAISLTLSLGALFSYAGTAIRHIRRRGKAIFHVASSKDYRLFWFVLLVIGVVLQAVALILSGSRGAVLAALASCGTLLMWYIAGRGSHKFFRFVLPLMAAGVLAIAVIGGGGTYTASLKRFEQLSDSGATVLPRFVIWKSVAKMIKAHPLGVGPGNFAEAFQAYQPQGFNLNRVYHAHNDYLQLTAELGLPGMALLLLALASVLAVAWRGRSAAGQKEPANLWVKRGALLGVLAGLLHAFVDFNISSRPGVAFLFFACLGLSLSLSAGRYKADGNRLRGKLRLGAAVGALVILAGIQIRMATASVMMRRGFGALGGKPSIYFMLPVPDLTTAAALREMQRAVKLVPGYSHARVMMARGYLLAQRKAVNAAAEKMRVEHPGVPIEQLRAGIAFMLRPEEKSALLKAKEQLEVAIKLAPRSVEALAQMSFVSGNLARLSDNREMFNKYADMALATGRKVTELAPHVTDVNLRVLRGLSDALQSGYADENELLRHKLTVLAASTGLRLSRISSRTAASVLDEFRRMGIEPSLILRDKLVPVTVIWRVYCYYRDRGDAVMALSALDALDTSLEHGDLGALSFYPGLYEQLAGKYRNRVVTERCRWALRLRKFASYIGESASRAALLRRYDKEYLKRAGADIADGSRFRYMALEKLYNGRGLAEDFAREFAELTKHYGDGREKVAEILSPWELFEPYSGDLANFPGESAMYESRIRLRRVLEAIKAGDRTAANRLLKLFDENTNDPDFAAAVIRHYGLPGIGSAERDQAVAELVDKMPAQFIGMQFAGRRIELTGITVSPNMVSCSWRFRSPVKSDLQMLLQVRDDRNHAVFSRAPDFSRTFPLEFGNGRPRIGKLFRMDIKLTPAVSKGSRLLVGIRHKSTGKLVLSEEGLPYLVCYDWLKLVNNAQIFRDHRRPSATICQALKIADTMPIEKFSHNLSNIFDLPRFYPLLNGKRQRPDLSVWQPCLSVADLVPQAVAAARRAFDSNPQLEMFSLGINDGQAWCECEACRRLLPADQQKRPASQRWWSDAYWSFVNAVAVEIARSNPGKRIGAIAYSNVVKPPGFNLVSNVTVYVCQDAGAHFDKKERECDRARLKRWTEICSDVGLYNYAGLISWIFPRYCRDEFAADLKYASDLGIKRFHIENYWVGDIDGPLPWIIQGLIDNPRQDAGKRQKIFCRYAYGAAADTMNAYFDYLQRVWDSAPRGRWFDGLFEIDQQVLRYPPSVMAKMRLMLQQAEAEVADNPAALARVRAVAEPLKLADFFVKENNLLIKLSQQPGDMQELERAEGILNDLRAEIKACHEFIAGLDRYTWGAAARRALAASSIETTIHRWERKEQAAISKIEQRLRVMRNMLGTGQ